MNINAEKDTINSAMHILRIHLLYPLPLNAYQIMLYFGFQYLQFISGICQSFYKLFKKNQIYMIFLKK